MSFANPMGMVLDPLAADSYRRRVHRPPPSHFAVDVLGGAKQGAGYSYGMRIRATHDADDNRSTSCQSLHTEYHIWRRWEDCLLFQNELETEYRRRARAKRQRLIRGKGIKRNGVYLHDHASSWESLPPGPDPNSVGRELSDYLPTLTKKSSVFRTNQATVDQRTTELKALVSALFCPGVPALLREIRNEHIVLDFFAYWQRDYEFYEKQKKVSSRSQRSRSSITSSLFSSYFSSPDLLSPGKSCSDSASLTCGSALSSTFTATTTIMSPCMSESSRIRKDSSDSSDRDDRLHRNHRRRTHSIDSSSSPSTASDCSSLHSPVQHPHSIQDLRVVDDPVSTVFNNDVRSKFSPYIEEHSMSVLGILPEDGELSLKEEEHVHASPPPRRRCMTSHGDSIRDRRGRIFLTPPIPNLQTPTPTEDKSFSTTRQSWQSIDSAARVVEGLPFELPPSLPPSPGGLRSRGSRSSIATFQTNCTVEGVLPRAQFDLPPPPASRLRRQNAVVALPKSRIVSCPISVTEYGDDWLNSEVEVEDGRVESGIEIEIQKGDNNEDSDDDVLDVFFSAESFPTYDIGTEPPKDPIITSQSTATTKSISRYVRIPDAPKTPCTPFFSPTATASSHQFMSGNGEAPASPFSGHFTRTPSDPAWSEQEIQQQQLVIKAGFRDTFIVLRLPNATMTYADLRHKLYHRFVGVEGVPLSREFSVSLVPLERHSSGKCGADTGLREGNLPELFPIKGEGDWECVVASLEGNKLTLRLTDTSI